MPTKVFVDNHLLRGMLSTKSLERQDALHQFNQLNHNTYEVVISQIALGELVSVTMRDFNEPAELANKLGKLYEHISDVLDVSICLPPPNKKSIEIAIELKTGDNNLDMTDLLIVAQALADKDSQRFLTRDKKLLDSEIIKKKEEELRNNNERNQKLKIVDGL